MPSSRLVTRLLLATVAGTLMLGCTEPPTKGGQTTQNGQQAAQTPSAKLVMAEVKDSLKGLSSLQQAAGAKPSGPSSYRVASSEWVEATSDKDGYSKQTRQLSTDTEEVASVLYTKLDGAAFVMELTDTVTKSATRKPGTYACVITMTSAESGTAFAQSTTFTPAGGGTAVKLDLSSTINGPNMTITAKGDLPDGSKVDLSFVSKTSPAIELGVKGDLTSATGKTISLDFLMDAQAKGSLKLKAATNYNLVFTMDQAANPPVVGKLNDDAGTELGKFAFTHDTTSEHQPLKATITYNDSSKAAEDFDFTVFDDISTALAGLSTSITNSMSWM
ncbi:MAG TPA: hypothetical protein V6D00_05530 [Pantanalinema sp.]